MHSDRLLVKASLFIGFAVFKMVPSDGNKGCAMLAPLRGEHANHGTTGHTRNQHRVVESGDEERREPLAVLPSKAGASMSH